MSPQYEDTVTGSADISGDPQPTRPLSPQEIQGQTARNVNRKQQGPQAQPARRSPQQEKKKQQAPDQGQDEPEPGQQANRSMDLQSMLAEPQSGNPLTGQDWFSGLQDDPETLHYALQEMYQRIAAYYKVGGPDFSLPTNLSRLLAVNKVQGGGGNG